MLKNKIKNILAFTSCLAFSLFTSCEDESKDPFDVHLDGTNLAPYAKITSSTSVIDVTKLETEGYSGLITVPSNNVASLSVSVTRTSAGVVSDTIPLQTITSFPAEFNPTGSDIANALGLEVEEILVGDSIQFIATTIGNDGQTLTFEDLASDLSGQPEQNQAYNFEVFIGCPQTDEAIDIVSGDWVINMSDSFGDGWQTTTGNGGGPGIVITLNDGTVYEIGLCTPYEDPGYNCTEGVSSGTRIINIPSGLTSKDWEWTFKGDTFSEIAFEIFTPNGNFVGFGTPGMSEGPIDLFLCAQ